MPDSCKIGLRNRGVCVVIPTYNNGGTIADVVRRTQAYCADIFVVLDGCTDQSLSELEALEERPRLIVLPRNTGKGHALKTGFRQALAEGFSYAVTLDGDGQHYPEDLPLLLRANRLHPDAIVVGRRSGLKDVTRSKSSRFANAFSNLWFFLQTLIPLRDTQSGYRLYPLRRLRGLSLLTSRYEAELELLVFAAWCGTRIVSTDVRVFYPDREERVSHFRPVGDFARISLLNLVLCVLALVFGLPLTILRWTFRALKTIILLLLYIILLLVFITPGVFIYLKFGRKTPAKKENLHGFICRTARSVSKVLGWVGNGYTLAGRTDEDFSRPAVIVCNHQSHLDLLPMLALTPKLVILTADWVWHNPLYGFVIREADYLPASRGVETIAPRLRELAGQGYSIVVYPEGTRSPDCSIGRFHQGAFYLAEQLDLDILPLVLYGTGKALPKHGRLLRPWPVRMEVDRRISHEELLEKGGVTLKSQASYLRKYYISRYTEIADQVERTLK